MTMFPRHASPDIYVERPSVVRRNDVLKECGMMGSRWKTQDILRFEVGERGMYCGWDFHIRNHAQVMQDQRSQASEYAREKRGVELKHIGSRKNYIDVGNLVILQDNCNEYKGLQHLIDGLDLRGVGRILMEKLKKEEVDQRGNVQIGGGFASENHKIGIEDDVTVPQTTNSLDGWFVEKMCRMSTLITEMAKLIPGMEAPFSSPIERVRKFAGRLPKEYGVEGDNIIEHMVFALTSLGKDKPILFLNHVDQFNCPVWREVFSCWEHIYDEHTEEWYRITGIAYARGMVYHHFLRQHGRDVLFDNMKKYFDGLPRERLELELRAPKIICDGDRERQILPNMNKQSFYGCFVTGIRRLSERYKLSLQRFAELLLPCAWVTTGSNLYKLHGMWLRHNGRLPENNLAVATLQEMLKHFDGLLKGKGQRFQPSFTFTVRENEVVGATKELVDILSEIRLRKDDLDYDTSWKRVQSIMGVGALGAQHCLAIAALCGVIPTGYASTAHVCEGTATHENIYKTYRLGQSTINRLTIDLSVALGVQESSVENGFCEYNRELMDFCLPYSSERHKMGVAKRKERNGWKHPDTVFDDQSFFFIKNSTVMEMDADGTTREATVMEFCLDGEYKGGWQSPMQELKVSKNSGLRGKCNTRHKAKPVRKKLVHSGFGGKSKSITKCQANAKANDMVEDEDESCDVSGSYTRYFSMKQKIQMNLQRVRTRSSSQSLRQPVAVGEIWTSTKDEGTYAVLDLHQEVQRILNTSTSGKFIPPKKKMRRFRNWCTIQSRVVKEGGIECNTYSSRMNGQCSYAILSSKHIVPSDGFYGFYDGLVYYISKDKAKLACTIHALTTVCTKLRLKGILTWAERKLPDERRNVPGRDFIVLYSKVSEGVNDHQLFGVVYFRGEERVLSVPTDPLSWEGCLWNSYPLGY